MSNNRPTNLYDLMEETAQHIEERPLNYYQGTWATDASLVHIDNPEACGTAYCRAGWMSAIGMDREVHNDFLIQAYATSLLCKAGISQHDINSLFNGHAIYIERSARGQGMCESITDKKYAKSGAQGVRDFMAKHEKKLKRVRLQADAQGVLQPHVG